MWRAALLPRTSLTISVALVGLGLVGAAPTVLRHARAAPQPRLPALVVRRRAPVPWVATQTIVAVGDSITKGDWDTVVTGGWVTRLGAKLRGAYPRTAFTVRNAGVDGDTTAGVLGRLTDDVLDRRPALVIISIGTNDFDDRVARTAFEAELRLLVHRLRNVPDPPVVVLASMLPIAGLAPARLLAERAYNDIIRRTAASARVGYLDLFDPWLALGPVYLRALRHDTEHPNPIGYELLASTTAAFLEAGYLDARGRVVAPAVPPTCSAVVCGG